MTKAGGEAAVVVVTGLSGAGKSTALRALDDAGYYCIDNLPPTLLESTVDTCVGGGLRRIALGIDVRVGAFLDVAAAVIEALSERPWSVEVLFLDAADDVLVRRFSETRRPHPILSGAAGEVAAGGSHQGPLAALDGVLLERERLTALRQMATVLLDSSHLTVHDLRRQVLEGLGSAPAGGTRMVTRMMSFGFKYGIPLDADVVFDVRFLDNPHFVEELRELTGSDEPVRDYVLSRPGCEELIDRLHGLIGFAMRRYEREGKSYLTVAIGCTGGRHRSVAIAEALALRLSTAGIESVGIVHRDSARGARMSRMPSPPVAGESDSETRQGEKL
jgi:UPF0042 nucleotide-binding protein